jgi:8-oxo-dGTP pyrophosphatase MutT (NUDIX family)
LKEGDVDVVVGVIMNQDKFLVERRGSDEKLDPNVVCLPGGHVRKNESLEAALKREMLEELGIKVKEAKFICRNFYVASNGERQNAHCFLIVNYEGKPVCRSAKEIFWTNNVEDLSIEVDRNTIRKLRELRLM